MYCGRDEGRDGRETRGTRPDQLGVELNLSLVRAAEWTCPEDEFSLLEQLLCVQSPLSVRWVFWVCDDLDLYVCGRLMDGRLALALHERLNFRR